MSVKIPFVDLSRAHAPLRAELVERFASVLDRSAFVLGREVEELETAFARAMGVNHAVGVSSGYDALVLGLRASGVGPGDEVITAANTFIATVTAISAVGAVPVLADVEEDCLTLSPDAAAAAVTPRTRAILPVHLFGQPASLEPLVRLAKSSGLALVEDVAQAHGAKYQGKPAGSFGAAGCFSFYPGKNLGSLGEGGAVTTNDAAIAEKLRVLRNVGQRAKNEHTEISGNHRLHTLQAAFLLAKLPHLESWNQQRGELAGQYRRELAGVSAIRCPEVRSDRTHVFHLFVISARDAADRDRIRDFLESRGIGTGIHYPIPVHLQPCYRSLGKGPGQFPIAERSAKSILSLPMFPGMRPDEVSLVCSTLREFFKC